MRWWGWGVGFKGSHAKNINGFKGGRAAKKIWCVKAGVGGGGVTKEIAFKYMYGRDSIRNNANISARMQEIGVSKVPKIRFSWGSMTLDSLLSYTPNGNSSPPTVSLQNTARVILTLFWPLLVYS